MMIPCGSKHVGKIPCGSEHVGMFPDFDPIESTHAGILSAVL
jgi:hypothetical protein